MTHTTEMAMLPFKVLELIEIIMEKKRMSFSDALFYLYNSSLYDRLADSSAKVWYQSGASLYEQLEAEKSIERNSCLPQSELRFLIFCIEQYRLRGKVSSADTLALFKRSGLLRFLTKNFEMLHSQSEDYILHEMTTFLKKHK